MTWKVKYLIFNSNSMQWSDIWFLKGQMQEKYVNESTKSTNFVAQELLKKQRNVFRNSLIILTFTNSHVIMTDNYHCKPNLIPECEMTNYFSWYILLQNYVYKIKSHCFFMCVTLLNTFLLKSGRHNTAHIKQGLCYSLM